MFNQPLMKKKIVIVFSLVLLIFGSTYFIHNNSVTELETSIEKKEKSDLANFNVKREQIRSDLTAKNEHFTELFDEFYFEDDAIKEIDTSISTFVYSNTLTYTKYDTQYLECLSEMCVTTSQNEDLYKIVYNKLDSIHEVYGDISSKWVSQMKSEQHRFLNSAQNIACQKYFTDNKTLSITYDSFDDFEDFLAQISIKEKEAKKKSASNKTDYSIELNKAKRSLNQEGREILETKMRASESTMQTSHSYIGNSLGLINYSFPVTTYPIKSLENAVEYAKSEQYRNNSLYNGAMPYSYCYGSGNSGRSGVRVNAGSGDVLVMIKNYSDKVIRHAYVQAHKSYTLNIPDGSYHVYFYYGKGWNPTKFMKNTTCGDLTGGFHSNEVVQKDPSTLSVYSQIMTYTLTEQINGNFNTTSSSKYEAF